MTNPSIPPCPVCGNVPKRKNKRQVEYCKCIEPSFHVVGSLQGWHDKCNEYLGRACRELGIETVEQVRELVGIACDACDERTVRATNRAENLVPLLRRRAVKGEKKYGR